MTGITDEMIEKAAAAFCRAGATADDPGQVWGLITEGERTIFRECAHAALAAALTGRTVVDLPQHQGVDILAAEYEVTVLPRDDINRASWTVCVSYRGNERYAVKHYSHCLSRSGTWDYEALPSEREDGWLAEHRFELAEALRLAAEHAPNVVTNGRTAVEVLAWIRERDAAEVAGSEVRRG